MSNPEAVHAALSESEARFRLLVQSVKDYAIFMLDPDGRVASWNEGAQRTKGYLAGDIIGRHFSCFYTQEDIASNKPAELLETARTQGRVEAEGWRVRKDGSRFWADVVLTAILDDNGVLQGFAKVTRDQTDRRRAAETLRQRDLEISQLQKMESVGRLAGGIAHDFNNLLSGIIGCKDEILHLVDKEHPVNREAQEIGLACERGSALIRQLMAFSRRQIATPTVLSLNDVVYGMKQLLQRTIGAQVELTFHLDPMLCTIRADVSQVEQILMNLAVNARDAMSGNGRLSIRTADRVIDEVSVVDGIPERPRHCAMLTVTDSGCGIPKEVLPQIFEPFFTTKAVGEGAGLGLATVYGIVQQHQGGISVYSSTELGTTFKIFLPASDGTSDESLSPSAQEVDPSPSENNEVILVVDDDALVLRNTVRSLQRLGFTVLSAASAEEAIVLFGKTRGKIRLLLTDVMMPGKNGKQLADELRKENPALTVLYMSGYQAETIAEHGILTGSIQFLEKPFNNQGLARKVHDVLHPSRPS